MQKRTPIAEHVWDHISGGWLGYGRTDLKPEEKEEAKYGCFCFEDSEEGDEWTVDIPMGVYILKKL